MEFYREIQFRVYRCLYEGCLPPPPPTVPAGRPLGIIFITLETDCPSNKTSLDFLTWSSDDDWISLDMTKPVAGANGTIEEWVTIPPGVWMVLDESPPPMVRLMIYGVLEIGDEADTTLSAEIIMIQVPIFIALHHIIASCFIFYRDFPGVGRHCPAGGWNGRDSLPTQL